MKFRTIARIVSGIQIGTREILRISRIVPREEKRGERAGMLTGLLVKAEEEKMCKQLILQSFSEFISTADLSLSNVDRHIQACDRKQTNK